MPHNFEWVLIPVWNFSAGAHHYHRPRRGQTFKEAVSLHHTSLRISLRFQHSHVFFSDIKVRAAVTYHSQTQVSTELHRPLSSVKHIYLFQKFRESCELTWLSQVHLESVLSIISSQMNLCTEMLLLVSATFFSVCVWCSSFSTKWT